MFRWRLRAPGKAAAAIVLAAAIPSVPALANHGRGGAYLETVYSPTVLAVPTSYTATAYVPSAFTSVLYPTVYSAPLVSPTSYVVEPTSYVVGRYVPTRRALRSAWRPYYRTSWAYTPTSYVSTSYVPTSYVSTSYVPTSYVPTSYVSTSYSSYLPTSYALPVVATSATVSYADPCFAESTTVVAPPSSVTVDPSGSGSVVPPLNPSAGNAPATSAPSGALQSTPRAGDYGAPAAPAEEVGTGAGEPALNDDFLKDPVPDEGTGAGGGLQPPVTPPASGGGEPGTGGFVPQGSSSSYKPTPTDLRAAPALAPIGVMRGVVLASAAGAEAPRSSAKVVFQDLKQTYTDTVATSDAEGRFEVVLPNGDWRVNIEDANGKLTPYGNIRVVSGRFYDEGGRTVTSLRLHE